MRKGGGDGRRRGGGRGGLGVEARGDEGEGEGVGFGEEVQRVEGAEDVEGLEMGEEEDADGEGGCGILVDVDVGKSGWSGKE